MQQLDRLTFFCLCALVFVLPASNAGVGIFAAVAIILFLIQKGILWVRIFQKKDTWKPLVDVPLENKNLLILLGVFLALNILSALCSHHPQLSYKALATKLLEHVFLYFVAWATINTPRRIRALANVFVVSVGLLGLDALFQLWSGQDVLGRALTEGRVSGLFKHPNGLAGYLVLVLPIIYVVCLFQWQRIFQGFAQQARAVLCGGIFLLGLITFGLTYSRGAWVGLSMAVLVLFFFQKKTALFFLGALVAFLLVFIPLLQSQRHVSLVAEGARPLPAAMVAPASNDWIDQGYAVLVNAGFGGSDRLIYWSNALKIIRDHIWTGTGINTYALIIKEYSQERAYYAHNCYLQMAGEIGLAGLIVFVWLLGAHILYAIRARAFMDSSGVLLWSGILAGFIGFCVHAFFDTIFYSVQHGALLWIFLGILAAGRSISLKNR